MFGLTYASKVFCRAMGKVRRHAHARLNTLLLVRKIAVFLLFLLSTQASIAASLLGKQVLPEVCRSAFFPLAGTIASHGSDTKDSLDICLTDPDSADAGYQIYTNGKKAFAVSPSEAKNFNVYISNTYSVQCTNPQDAGSPNNAAFLPKLNFPIKIDAARPLCLVSTSVSNTPFRAVYSFDDYSVHDFAVFEPPPREHRAHDAFAAAALDSPCEGNFNPDGTPTPCLKQHEEARRNCPNAGQSCLNPTLAGAWIHRNFADLPKSFWVAKPPEVYGWVFRPDGVVRQLAIDFTTGKLAEGQENLAFLKISYGCNGELYQESYFVGSLGKSCGRYAFSEKEFGFSRTKQGPLELHKPTAIGAQYIAPVAFTFQATLGTQSISAPQVASRLPAYAEIVKSEGNQHLIIRFFDDAHNIVFRIPKFERAEVRRGRSSGVVAIEKRLSELVAVEFQSREHQLQPNEFTVDVFDLANGRISGHFDFHVISPTNKRMRFTGRFDLPFYVRQIEKKSEK